MERRKILHCRESNPAGPIRIPSLYRLPPTLGPGYDVNSFKWFVASHKMANSAIVVVPSFLTFNVYADRQTFINCLLLARHIDVCSVCLSFCIAHFLFMSKHFLSSSALAVDRHFTAEIHTHASRGCLCTLTELPSVCRLQPSTWLVWLDIAIVSRSWR
jgi:hypothetical protein